MNTPNQSHSNGRQIKLHFQRFEFKYLLNEAIKEKLKQYLLSYVVMDKFAEETQGKRYQVVSLYYDSPLFYYHHEKVDGVKIRKKIRLRTYQNDGKFSNNCFLEIKRKCDSVVLKDRVPFDTSKCEDFIKNPDIIIDDVASSDNKFYYNKIKQEFLFESYVRSLSPRLLVRYYREPFLGRFNKNLRVTFDYNIQAVENDNLFYNGSEFHDVSQGFVIMEIKFTGSLPFYIGDVIKKFSLQRIPFSKYCEGINICGSVNKLITSPIYLLNNNLDQISNFNHSKIWKIF